MKKFSKLLLMGAIALGLAACNNEDVPTTQEGNTHVSVTVSMSLSGTSTRALPIDYNYLGEWAGKDKITSLTVYLVDGASVSSKTFTVGTTGTDYLIDATGANITLLPQTSAAIRTTAGMKKVYVVVNPTDEITSHLNKTPVAEFEKNYQEAALISANSGTSTTVSTSAQKLATKNGVANETIVMTNVAPQSLDVLPNITADETIASSPKNRAKLQVERAVARVMVTTAEDTYEIPTTNDTDASILGTISNITWVLAQGENSLFVQRKTDWPTPNYGWLPTDDATYWGNAGTKYDYSGLFENNTNKFGGTDVPKMTAYATNTVDKITDDLDLNLSGKFVLPTTHATGVKAASNYKKGNTVYALIRAQFTPSDEAYADGGEYTSEADFYVGENGKFYTSAANTQDPLKGGVAGQKATKYVGGKVLYYAWANPDVVPDWYNSPVIRNNVYHIHITGFKNLGTNWNPLFPEDPANPTLITDPNNPTGPQIPSNPDPKPVVTVPDPNNPTGPEIPIVEPENPINPKDPLTTLETWMSVDVTVLPWKLHSYSVELGI
jgi:hypothetical protein